VGATLVFLVGYIYHEAQEKKRFRKILADKAAMSEGNKS
jgi:hypothetical protein